MPTRFAYHPALDGIRALAVAAVVLFHGGVSWLPGGFLGVDAFFVLSGFLITSLLLTEHAATGRIRLGEFWVRRARRLLPALLLVLVATVLAYRSLLASAELALLRGDALAALGYVANWRMIYRGDDYFTQTAGPSPLQHTWSLGIEEQFYVLWPLILGAVLVWAARRRNAVASDQDVLAAACIAGAAASALAAGLLWRSDDVSRSYFGTDTRAQALLIGCALAAVLTPRAARRTPPAISDAVAVLGVVGLGVACWLWANASGAAPWLYQGGLTIGGLAVAAVIAHVMLSPADPVGRLLALAPLVWLGRISYGVYLWHWPLFGLLTADRTGLTGLALLATRVAATVALAAASYWLVEQPIRTRRVPWQRWPGAPRWAGLSRVNLKASAVAVVATGALVVAGTAEVSRPSLDAVFTLPSAAATEPTDRVPPIKRAGRRAGTEPRVTFFGDSVSWSLGTYLPAHPGLTVTVRSVQGCGIARLPDLLQRGDGGTNYPGCSEWDTRWRKGVAADDPDVAVILLDRWELMDRRIDGEFHHVGEAVYDAYLSSELETAIDIVSARGAHVALLTAPYTRRAERRDGSLYDEDLPERVDAWNLLLYRAQARHPENVTIVDLKTRVCPDGVYTWSVGDGLRIRSDGLHFTANGVRQWIAPWLMPKLAALAVGAPLPD